MTGHPEIHLLGVRLRDSARLRYVTSNSDDIAVGTWVVVATGQGEEPAQVIVAPEPMAADTEPEKPAPVVRILDDAEIQQMTPACGDASLEVSKDTRQMGGVGYADPARRGISHEDQHYRQVKGRFPRLGQRLVTARGAGMVVSLDVFNEILTVRYDENGKEESLGVADFSGLDGMQEEG